MTTENKDTKQLITSYVLKAVNCSTTLNKPVLRFPQDKLIAPASLVFIKHKIKKLRSSLDGRSDPCRPREEAASHMEMGMLICPAYLYQLLICRQHVQAGQEQGGNVSCLLAQPLTSQRQDQALHPHGCQSAPRSPQIQASCGMQMTQRPKASQVRQVTGSPLWSCC